MNVRKLIEWLLCAKTSNASLQMRLAGSLYNFLLVLREKRVDFDFKVNDSERRASNRQNTIFIF